MKKLFAVLLTATLALSLFIPTIYADDSSSIKLEDGSEGIMEEVLLPGFNPPSEGALSTLLPLEIYGTIVAETETSITVKDNLSDNTVVLNISENTYIVDATTGIATLLKDRTSDNIAAFYGPATTMSIPAQSNAVALALNLPENSRSPKYVIAEAVVRTENAVKVTANNGSIIITITDENPLAPYLTRNIVTLDHIQVGAELLVWYDIVAMSYPGQTTSNRTVFFGNKSTEGSDITSADENSAVNLLAEITGAKTALPISENNGSITVFTKSGVAVVNKTEVNLEPAFYSNEDTLMIPLRAVCEALGFEVNWIPNTAQVELTKGDLKVTLEFGKAAYTVQTAGSDEAVAVGLEQAPELDNTTNRSYVPVDFFKAILNVDITIDNSEV